MMIKKIVFVAIFTMAFLLLLTGCNAEIESLFYNMQKVEAVDATAVITITYEGETQTITMQIVSAERDGSVIGYISMPDLHMDMYLINNKVITLQNGEVLEVLSLDMGAQDDSQAIYNTVMLDLSDIKYELRTEKLSDTEQKYTMSVNHEDINKVFGLSELGMTGVEFTKCEMNIIANRVNKLPNQMSIIFDTSIGMLMHIDITYNNFNDEVTIEIPQYLINYLDDYNGNNDNGDNNDDDGDDEDEIFYEDTLDGIVKYTQFDRYISLVYDDVYNRIVILREDSIDIYHADSLTLLKQIKTLVTPQCIDTDNGVLAVGYGDNYQLRLYDLNEFGLLITKQTDIMPCSLVMDENMIIYADDDQHCKIKFYNIENDTTITYNCSVYQPKLSINRVDHILYVCETNISSSNLMYFSSLTGETMFCSDFGLYEYNNKPVKFDGRSVHYFGRTFHATNGSSISSNNLSYAYQPMTGFTPAETVYNNDKLSFVYDNYNNTAVYSHCEDRFLYKFNFKTDKVYLLNSGDYLFICNSAQYIATVDVSLISETLLGGSDMYYRTDNITQNANGSTKLQTAKGYQIFAADDSYLYLMDEIIYTLDIYDISSLQKIKSFLFPNKPICIDVDNGSFAVGFGDESYFLYYKDLQSEPSKISVNEEVFSVLLYEDNVIYTGIDQWCYIYIYNLTEAVSTFITFKFNPFCALNREQGILYMGDTGSSRCNLMYYDLIKQEIIFSAEFLNGGSYINSSYFDGNHVHYAGKTFNKLSGIITSSTDCARAYDANYSNITTIYDDDAISVFSGYKGNKYYVVYYDLTSDVIIAIYEIQTYKLMATSEYHIIVSHNREYLLKIPL